MKNVRLIMMVLLGLIIHTTSIYAQKIETVELCDGSLLEGYISEQVPGKSLTFTASCATIMIPSQSVASIVDYPMEYASLSADWKQWTDENLNGTDRLVLSDILLNEEKSTPALASDSAVVADKRRWIPAYLKSSPHKVRILEKGASVKYIDFTPQTFRLQWSDVRCIFHSRRSDLALSGLNSIIRLKDNHQEYKGEIVEQILSKQIRLLKDDGVVEVINANQIAVIRKEKLNPNQNIFEQSVLLDQVYTQENECLTGLIVEQNFVHTKEKPASFRVIDLKGKSYVIPFTKVIKYGRFLNSDYQLQTDVILDDTTVLINRKKVQFTEFEQDETAFLYAKDLSKIVTLDKNKLEGGNIFTLELKESTAADYSMIRAVVKLNKEKKKNKQMIGFTYENFAIYSTRASEQTCSVNGTLRLKFVVDNPGWYVLYLPRWRKGIVCLVK